MRYSEVLGQAFYKIKLTEANQDLVDTHFTAASHHFIRYKECQPGSREERFHLLCHRAHLKCLFNTVHLYGDFSLAEDPSGMGLDKKEGWNPKNLRVPDPAMFSGMMPEASSGVGVPHSSDIYLNINFEDSDHLTVASDCVDFTIQKMPLIFS